MALEPGELIKVRGVVGVLCIMDVGYIYGVVGIPTWWEVSTCKERIALKAGRVAWVTGTAMGRQGLGDRDSGQVTGKVAKVPLLACCLN